MWYGLVVWGLSRCMCMLMLVCGWVFDLAVFGGRIGCWLLVNSACRFAAGLGLWGV